jgi:hypothetical protein
MSISSEILAERLVRAFGDPDAIGELLTADAEWWITPAVGVLGSLSVGREAIVAAMRVIFGNLWKDAEEAVHHVIGNDDIGAPIHATGQGSPMWRPLLRERVLGMGPTIRQSYRPRLGIPRCRLVHGATADMNRGTGSPVAMARPAAWRQGGSRRR